MLTNNGIAQFKGVKMTKDKEIKEFVWIVGKMIITDFSIISA